VEYKNVENYKFYFRNEPEFEKTYKAVFNKEEYKIPGITQDAKIIDCGSHIGVSVLYFKHTYPESKIIAFEPDPDNFDLLSKNVKENNIKDIRLINSAVSDKTGETALYGNLDNNDWSWGNTIIKDAYLNWSSPEKCKVKTVKLSDYINNKVDLIKLDIEGMEFSVLKEISHKLNLVENFILEHHYSKGYADQNKLEDILFILESNNFDVKVVNEDPEDFLYETADIGDFMQEIGLDAKLIYATKKRLSR